MKRRIAILFHEADRGQEIYGYSIFWLIPHWEKAGHEVVLLFGVDEFVPADLVIVHVDLSVVPEEYLALARRYPISVNGKVRDIRKSSFSQHLLQRGDTYGGAVIVKSDRNFAGYPEAARGVARMDGKGMRPFFRSPLDYRIYPSLGEVPDEAFDSLDLVVQKFLPEMDEGRYFVRLYQFLGDQGSCTLCGADDPIVKSETELFKQRVEPHPEILEWRRKLGIDYGKLDYVIHEGQVILLDVNKTTGTARRLSPRIEEIRRITASGLYSYFRD